MNVQKKLTNVRDFVNNMLSIVCNIHDYIGTIFITSMGADGSSIIPMSGSISIQYIKGERYEILKVSSIGEDYYDNIIKNILKLIGVECVPNIVSEYRWYNIDVNAANNKIVELSNYSDEELKLYFKLL